MPDHTFKAGDLVRYGIHADAIAEVLAIRGNEACIWMEDAEAMQVNFLNELEPIDDNARLVHSLRKLLNTDDVYIEVALLMQQSSRDALNAKIVAKLHDMLGQDVDPLEEVSKLIKARETNHAD